MINRYNDFLLENLLNESILVYSDKFKNLLKNIDSPIAKALLDIESKDFTVANNYIDISDDKEQISFIPDRRAQQIFNPENLQKFAVYGGNGGFLTHSDSNAEIFKLLDYTPNAGAMFHPEVGERGEILSRAVGPQSGRTYLKIQFPNGVSVVNQDKVRYDDPVKLAFTQGRQKIRTGRGINGILNSANLTFSASELEKFVNLYKAEIEKMNDVFRNFELVSGDDIAFWYNYKNYELEKSKGTLSSSCMASVPASFFEIYTDNEDVCSLLILKTEDGSKIKGRALVWKLRYPKDVTFLDRIYTHNDSDVELFRQYAQKKGWYHKPSNNNAPDSNMIAPDGSKVDMGHLVVEVSKSSYSRYPYVDTIKYFNQGIKTLSTSDDGEYIVLEDTGGSYVNSGECDFCGNDGRVDCPECDGNGEITCSECDGDGDLECSECSGSGKLDCNDCDGEGEIECSTCDGTGKDPDNEDEDCSDCDGKGLTECSSCDGEGDKECDECDNGRVECSDCSGRGENECYNCEGSCRVDCPECS